MKICPKCKNEYREGINYCPDCDCELVEVDEQSQEQKLLIEASYPMALKATEYLEYCHFSGICLDEPDEEGLVRLYCDEKDHKEAFKQVQVFLQEEMKRAMEEKLAGMSPEELEELKEENATKVFSPSNVYQNYEEKASENKSSAYSFLIFGVVGIAVVVLSWFDMLPFSIGGSGNWFSHGIMLTLFVIFLIVGIISAKSVGKYKALADKEADTQSELEEYLNAEFTYEVLSEVHAESEEEAYFKRMSYMRKEVSEKYSEAALDESFVEALLDAHYDKIFG